MIETHVHLYDKAFDEDRSEVIERALQAGVQQFYMPNVDHESIDGMLAVEDKFPEAIATMGLHPCSVEKNFEKQLYEVEDWLSKRKFVAVGEIGLDFYWDVSLKEEQIEALKIQIDLAKKYQIPIILHCRDSFEETFQIVKEMHDENLTGVFHCFTGNSKDAEKVNELGFYVGIGGIATFKNGGLIDHLASLSTHKMVLETDAPYLAPVPKRGKRNEPLFLQYIAEKIADKKEMAVEDLITITTQNAQNLFNAQ